MSNDGRLKNVNWGRGTDVEQVRRMRFPGPSGQPFQPSPDPGRGPVMVPPASQRPNAASSPFVRLTYPPWVEKLGGISRDFNVSDFAVALPAGVNNTATSAVLRFQLPSDAVGWIQQMQLYVLSPLATTSVQFTLRINEAPVPGFDNKRNPPGVANLILIDINDLRVRAPMASVLDILFTNLDGAAVTVGGLIAGWYHPRAAELELWGQEI